MALEAALAVVVYLVGRWTPPLAVVNAVLALAVAVPALILLAQGQLLNPEYFPTIIPEDGEKVAAIVGVLTGIRHRRHRDLGHRRRLDQDRARAPLSDG